MRTHEHAMVSMMYVFSSSLLFGSVCSDPYWYAVAVVGGEVIDVIDHPLHFLVYGRNQPHVLKSKSIFKQEYDEYLKNSANSSTNKVLRLFESLLLRFRAAIFAISSVIKYLDAVEDRREIKGLLLHNVLVLVAMSLACLLISVLFPVSVEILVFLGSFLLHMICDILGDIWTVGHFSNWLSIIPKRWHSLFNGRPRRFLSYALPINLVVFSSFFLVSIRWSTQLSGEISNEGLFFILFKQPRLVVVLFLIGLVVYIVWLMLVLVLLLRKYNIEFGRGRVVFFQRSISILLKRLFRSREGDLSRNIYLKIRSDILSWAVFGSVLTATILILLDLLGLSNDFLIFFIPFSSSIIFGSMIHTSVGEFSGVLGVTTALLVNSILSKIGYQDAWSQDRAILLFVSAVAAWSMGLIGGLFFRGKEKMSVVVCSFEVYADSIISKGFVYDFFEKLENAVRNGYSKAHSLLQKTDCNITLNRLDHSALALFSDKQVAMTSRIHWRISSGYSPLLRELEYLFCDNLMVCSSQESDCSHPIPVMPKTRVGRTTVDPEMIRSGSVYNWYYRGESLRFDTLVENCDQGIEKGLSKLGGEFLDNLVTLQVKIVTDLYISSQSNSLICTFLVREATSSKEYATVEAELYLAAVIDELKRSLSTEPVRIELFSSRIVFPSLSIFDYEVVEDKNVLFFKNDPESSNLRRINRFIKSYSSNSSLSRQIFERVWSTAIELLIGSILGFFWLYSTSAYNFILRILGNWN
jgi:hypothetical protein